MNEESTTESAARILREWGEIDILRVVVVVALAFLAIELIRRVISWFADRLPDRFRFYVLPWAPILRLVILLGVVFYVTPLIIRPTTENLLAILGALAVAMGFAFKDYVSSLLAGVVVLYERPYRSGDWIQIGDAYGEVIAMGLRTVQIVTPEDTVVSVPHGRIWNDSIHNDNSGRRELMCVADFHVLPNHDAARVRQVLRNVAYSSPYTQLRKPVIVVLADQPWGTKYALKAYPIDARDQFDYISDLTIRAKRELLDEGVRFAEVGALPYEPRARDSEGRQKANSDR